MFWCSVHSFTDSFLVPRFVLFTELSHGCIPAEPFRVHPQQFVTRAEFNIGSFSVCSAIGHDEGLHTSTLCRKALSTALYSEVHSAPSQANFAEICEDRKFITVH